MSFIEDSWITHAKGKYPREFASPERLRKPVESDEDLIKLIRAYAPAFNIYLSAYSFDDWVRDANNILIYNNAIIDLLFIDLDCTTLPYALYEARMLDLYLNHHKCQPRVYCTGNKGFAVYIDFPEVKLDKVLVKPVLRKFLESIQSVLSLLTIDRVCFDSISRISRMPNTKNRKSGRFCIPLSRKQLWSPLKDIIKLTEQPSKTPIIINKCMSIPSILLGIEADLKAQQLNELTPLPNICTHPSSTRRSEGTGAATSLCPGIVDIVDGVSKGSRDNSLCAVICALNLQSQKTKDEIFPIVKEWARSCTPPIDMTDFKLSNKIDHLVDNNFRPCTFALRTGNPMCAKCSVASR